MRKVAKKVCKLSLFSQLSAPIKSGVTSSVSCVLLLLLFYFLHSCAKILRTYRVVRILRNISTYRVCGPAFPLHLRARKLSPFVALRTFGIVSFTCCTLYSSAVSTPVCTSCWRVDSTFFVLRYSTYFCRVLCVPLGLCPVDIALQVLDRGGRKQIAVYGFGGWSVGLEAALTS